MADFVSGNDDARETTSVLDDSDAVHLLQSLVNNARSTDVGESFWAPRNDLVLFTSHIFIIMKSNFR